MPDDATCQQLASPGRDASYRAIEPRIIYPGTPVALIASTNPDGSANLAPDVLLLGPGLDGAAGIGPRRTDLRKPGAHRGVRHQPAGPETLVGQWNGWPPSAERTRPHRTCWPMVVASSGTSSRPRASSRSPRRLSARRGYGIATCSSRVGVAAIRPLADEPDAAAVEVRVIRIHAAADILKADGRQVDPARWHPLLYNFRCYQGLGPELGRSFREGR